MPSRVALLAVWLVILPSASAGPLEAAPPDRPLIGASYFAGWWRPLPNKWNYDPAVGDWRTMFPERVPLLGEYNEQPTMDKEIVAASDHGVDFFLILWYYNGPGGSQEREKNARFLNEGVRTFTNSPEARRMKFAIEYCNHAPYQVNTVRVAGIVLKWIRTDKEANFRRAEAMIRQAAAGGAQIVCTTECFLDGYAIADKSIPLDTYRGLGEPIPEGPYFKRLAALARELKIVLVAGMLEADGEARYNTAALISPEGGLLGKYRKQELGHELVRNRPGTSSPVFDTRYGRVGVLICADRTVPEIAQRMKHEGAEFLLCPSGGMFGAKSNDPILQARSRETGLTIVFVHPAEFLVTGPDGSVLQQTVLGDVLLVSPAELGTAKDANRVFCFELPAPTPERKTH